MSRLGLTLLAIVALAVGTAPLLADPAGLSVTAARWPRMAPPSLDCPLGTDESGRSVLTLLLWGGQLSLLVGCLATLLSVLLGSLIGLLAGHFRGWTAAVLMAVTDWFLVLPALLLAMVLAAVLDPGWLTTVLAIGLTSWAGTARLVRAQTLAVQARPHLERVRVLGAGHGRILVRHTLPEVLPLILADAVLTVGDAIIAESTLAFLGLGDPTRVSWGGMLQSAFGSGAISAGAWWVLLAPGLAITVVVAAFTLCGRSLEARFALVAR